MKSPTMRAVPCSEIIPASWIKGVCGKFRRVNGITYYTCRIYWSNNYDLRVNTIPSGSRTGQRVYWARFNGVMHISAPYQQPVAVQRCASPTDSPINQYCVSTSVNHIENVSWLSFNSLWEMNCSEIWDGELGTLPDHTETCRSDSLPICLSLSVIGE